MSIEYDNNCFPGIVTSDETCFRFTDKGNVNSPNERLLFSNWWREQINQFGTQVSYFVNTFDTLSADNIYGEQPTKAFADPRNIVIAATLNDNAITLSQFGFQSDDDVTAYIHISSFETTFSDLTGVWSTQHDIIEPKAGDVFQLSEFGNDRPNDRQAKYFEITQKLDQDIASMNQLGGHYVFLIKAKRLDYSFEPNIPFPLSGGNAQVYEGNFAGRQAGGTNTATESKKDNYDAYDIDQSSKDVFDMSSNDDVYGDYY